MSNEQKPAASTLERKVYWAKRDTLEENIAHRERSVVATLPGDSCAEFLPKWNEELAAFRERLTALGEPPGPRVRESDASDERRDHFIAAALTGILADPGCTLSFGEIVANAVRYADDTIARASEDGEP